MRARPSREVKGGIEQKFILLLNIPTHTPHLITTRRASARGAEVEPNGHWQIAGDHNSGGIMVRLMQPITNSESVRHTPPSTNSMALGLRREKG